MVHSERGQLSGIVEVDEALLGGVAQGGKRGCGANKSIVVIGSSGDIMPNYYLSSGDI
jgi:hypothetical protein